MGTLDGTYAVPNSICAGRFEIGQRLGSGSFGEVYRGLDLETQQPVAIKVEDSRTGQLHKELDVLRKLQEDDEEQPQGFVKILYFGRKGERFCLVMECLGQSIEDRLRYCGGRFSSKTTVLVMQQMLGCIEHLHSKGAVHRDVKPENFMCGVGKRRHHLYMIDFGLAEWYFGPNGHVPLRREEEFKGTMRYASINAQRYCTQSRRDDLEAAGHTMLYFMRGSLPWSGLHAESRTEQYRKVRELKEQTPLSVLCAGLPTVFEKYLSYCRRLGYDQRPDYAMLQRLFSDLRCKLEIADGKIEDYDFDWECRSSGEDELEPLKPRPEVRQPDDEPLPRCPGCTCELAWSKYAEGSYASGWACNNFARCGFNGTTSGELRWFCKACSNDFCTQCARDLGRGEARSTSLKLDAPATSKSLRRMFACGSRAQVSEPGGPALRVP